MLPRSVFTSPGLSPSMPYSYSVIFGMTLMRPVPGASGREKSLLGARSLGERRTGLGGASCALFNREEMSLPSRICLTILRMTDSDIVLMLLPRALLTIGLACGA